MPTIQELYFHGRNGELSPAWIFNGSGWTDKLKVKANNLFSNYMLFPMRGKKYSGEAFYEEGCFKRLRNYGKHCLYY